MSEIIGIIWELGEDQHIVTIPGTQRHSLGIDGIAVIKQAIKNVQTEDTNA